MVSEVVKGRVGWHVAWTKVTDIVGGSGWILDILKDFLIYGTGGE